MTIAMPDSITPGNMPMGYEAYLGYVDGKWPTAPRLHELFPGAKVVSLTVTGATLDADGIDCEPGNPNAMTAAAWTVAKRASGAVRPVVYADLASDGYSMSEVLAALAHMGVTREQVRVLTAHYTAKAHICSPAAGCKDKDGNPVTWTADGTQWTSQYPGVGGSRIDMSCLADDFFGAPQSTDWTETIVQQLPTVKQGQSGNVVRTVQGLCCARGRAVTVDGTFGPLTTAAVKAVQAAAKITADGVVGPQTWPALLGVM